MKVSSTVLNNFASFIAVNFLASNMVLKPGHTLTSNEISGIFLNKMSISITALLTLQLAKPNIK